MNPIETFQDLDSRGKKQVVVLGVVVLILVGVLCFFGLRACQSSVAIDASRLETDERAAISQVRDVMFAVSTALTGENPVGSVDAAAQMAATQLQPNGLKSRVDGTSLKLNPDIEQWVSQKQGGAIGDPLVVGPAPESYRKRGVALIGIGRGGIPLEIASGSEPAWFPNAVHAP